VTGQHLILYDGACGLCRRSVAWAQARDPEGRFRTVPYQEAPGLTPTLRAACARAVHVVRADGGILKGGRAVLFVLEHTGMPRLARAASRPPLVWLVELGYRLVAANRGWIGRVLFRTGAGRDTFHGR
jgi:predicted DCC family thiol-disulfide oxidoreductase YuxK